LVANRGDNAVVQIIGHESCLPGRPAVRRGRYGPAVERAERRCPIRPISSAT
jgi:hypothetical protein